MPNETITGKKAIDETIVFTMLSFASAININDKYG